MLQKYLPSFFLLIILTACGHSLPKFDNIDLSVWKEDKNACIGNRTKTLVHLDQQKDKLKSLSEMEIIKLLGKPDRNELYKRNQKFYYYFLEPGLECGVDNSNPKHLSIRFNAMGLAKEVLIE